MTNNKDDLALERAKKIIYDESNVTESNVISDFLKIILKIILVLSLIYFSIFLTLTVILKTLSVENQIKLENLISKGTKFKEIKVSKQDKIRLENIKSVILKADKTFPKTSNLKIFLIDEDILNAFCAPNGNIYITKKFFDKLNNDGELMFVLSHEMSHYKDKDHLMKLRSNITGSILVFITNIFSANSNVNIGNMVDGVINLSDLKYSRNIEMKCDKYAAQIVKKQYMSIQPAINALNILKKDDTPDVELFLTHPNIDKRIEAIKKLD